VDVRVHPFLEWVDHRSGPVDSLGFLVSRIASKWNWVFREEVKVVEESSRLLGRDSANRQPIACQMLVQSNLPLNNPSSSGMPLSKLSNVATSEVLLMRLHDDMPAAR